MSHWPYIIASYVLTIGGMAGLALVSWLRMRKAEAQAAELSTSRSSRAQSRDPAERSEALLAGARLGVSTSLDTNGEGAAHRA